MNRIAGILVLVLCTLPLHAQDAALQKRVEATSKKVSDAFVFLPGGSGVLISDDGWLLTNHHVIAPPIPTAKVPSTVQVWLCDSTKLFTAKVVCTDGVGDIALLKIESKEKLPFVTFADSDKIDNGQYVIAVGNPFGMASEPAADRRFYPSVSLGIVSCQHRYQQQYTDCIQTDAAVNPGNSGGPLVDLDGKLVGINGRIATRYGNRVNSGVGYAIPANQIANFLPQMKAGGIEGKIHHGQVTGLDISREPTGGEFAKVWNVQTSSSAEKAGFKTGDRILAVNGLKVTSWARYMSLVGIHPNETLVTFSIEREGAKSDIKVLLDRGILLDIHGKVEARGNAWLGASFEDSEDGLKITFLRSDGPAEKADIRVGDLILEVDGVSVVRDVDGKKIVRRDTLTDRVYLKKPGDPLRLKIKRDSGDVEITVKLGKKAE